MSDDEDDFAEVIELRPGQDVEDDARPIAKGDRDYSKRYCLHRKISLDSEVRRAYCRACGVEVPCFDYLVSLAGEWERFIYARKEAERRAEVAKANLEELLRDERNAKARRRTWAKHEPEAVRHLRAVLGLFGGERWDYWASSSSAMAAARDWLDGTEEPEQLIMDSGRTDL